MPLLQVEMISVLTQAVENTDAGFTFDTGAWLAAYQPHMWGGGGL
jgi:hypothetical protein